MSWFPDKRLIFIVTNLSSKYPYYFIQSMKIEFMPSSIDTSLS
jgi:hypothetical protein